MWSLEKIAWTLLTCFAVFCIFGALAGYVQEEVKKNPTRMNAWVHRGILYGSLIWLIWNIQ